MEMKKRRGYAEMRLLLRRTNVNFSSYGEPLLEIAIMSYLKDENQSLEDLMKNAEENSPMSIPEGETAFDLIKDALQNAYTRHSFKVESEMFILSSWVLLAVKNKELEPSSCLIEIPLTSVLTLL